MSPLVQKHAAKLAAKAKWTVSKENYLLADLAVMLWVLDRSSDLQTLGHWLATELPFAGSYSVWDGVAHAIAVCARGTQPAPAEWVNVVSVNYTNTTVSLCQGKMEDGELALIRLDETRASAPTAVRELTTLLAAQALTWTLMQGPGGAKKFAKFDKARLEQLVADASGRLRPLLAPTPVARP